MPSDQPRQVSEMVERLGRALHDKFEGQTDIWLPREEEPENCREWWRGVAVLALGIIER